MKRILLPLTLAGALGITSVTIATAGPSTEATIEGPVVTHGVVTPSMITGANILVERDGARS